MNRPTQGWLRGLEFLLLFVGISCAGYLADVHRKASAAEKMAAGLQDQKGRERPATVVPGLASWAKGNPSADAAAVIAQLDIPLLKISVPILSDDQSNSLLQGVGHVPGTAYPGGLGNVGIAGHRDTYFRALRHIQPRMDVQLRDTRGVFHYEVDSTEIVTPQDVRVLDTRERPELTLITCYPFTYVGAAPLRFIIHAHLLSVIPDDAGHAGA